MRGMDIRVLFPPRAHPPHGHAAPGTDSSGFSAGLVSLPAVHEISLDDSNGDVDSKVDAHPPCPIQIGVCPQSRQTPDLGTPASQLTAVGHTQDCAATGTVVVIPPHFLDAENAFLNRKEDPLHPSWTSCSEPQHKCIIPIPLLTRALVTIPPRHLASTMPAQITMTLNGRGLSQPPPFLSRMTCAPLSSRSNSLMPPMTHRLHTSVTMLFLSGIHRRPSHSGRHTVHCGSCRI